MDTGGGTHSQFGKIRIALGIIAAALALAILLVWGFGFRAPFGGMIPVSVHGSVIDATSGNPLPNAKIAFAWMTGGDVPPEVETVGQTDDLGRFAIDCDVGYGGNRYQIGWEEHNCFPFYLLLEKDGYQPVNVFCHPPDMELRHDTRQKIEVGKLKMTLGDDSAEPKEEFLPLPP